ncbi:hypothetical protein I3843_15G007300 [Carya illinoinensis]|nr:hypothetical protein I3843_15G007300 [Carya illinoinensis]
MKIMSWNSRGLGNPRGVRTLRDFVRREAPDVVFITETRSRTARMEFLKVQMGFSCFLPVGGSGRRGGVCLFWRSEVNLILRSYSPFHFDVLVSDCISGISWRLSAIYGRPETSLRHNTWHLLRLLKDQFSGPWLCCGDFNEILDISEKSGGRVRPASQMRGFREALDYCQLRSLPAVGPLYTWCNFREGPALIHERLDRFLSNMDWLALFPNCQVSNLPTPVSDHSCLVLTTDASLQPTPRRTRLFKFESMWVGEGCEESITRAWFASSNSSLVDKIAQCGRYLSDWSKACFGNVRLGLAKKRKELESLHSSSLSSYPLHEIRRVKHDLNYLMEKEELMWQQRSRVLWLANGDQNTKFFHFKATQRQRRNSISGLKDDDGFYRV